MRAKADDRRERVQQNREISERITSWKERVMQSREREKGEVAVIQIEEAVAERQVAYQMMASLYEMDSEVAREDTEESGDEMRVGEENEHEA